MELEALKEILNKNEPRYSRQEIEGIFEVRAQRTVGNLTKIMRYDLIIMIVMAIAMISLTFALNLQDRYFISLEILLVTGVLYLHYAIKRKVIYNQLSKVGIKSSIENILAKIKLYINLYLALVPIILCTVYLKTSFDVMQAFEFSHTLFWVLILITIPLAYVTYKVTEWLANRLYKPTLEKLTLLNNQFKLSL